MARTIRRAVVTGGAGFIGSHVVDGLVAAGSEVLVIDSLISGSRKNLESSSARGSVTLLEADIVSEQSANAIEAFQADTLFHLAAQMNVRVSVDDPSADATSNILGLIQTLGAFGRGGGKQVVFSSTGGAIYGEQETFPADEDHPVHAESPYGVSKRCGELYLDYFARKFGFGAVALRFANVYGPRQNPKGEAGVVSIFCKRLIEGDPLKINGSGEQTRDYVYVGDVVRACILAAEELEPGSFAFNVGTGQETDLLRLAQLLIDTWNDLKQPTDPVVAGVVHGPALAGEQMRSCITPARLTHRLGWKPEMPLGEGLRATLQYEHAKIR